MNTIPRKEDIYMLLFALAMVVVSTKTLIAQTTVTYIMQDEYFPIQINDGGDFFNQGATELGMWANQGINKNAAAWRTFKTTGDNTGIDRPLQVGDVFKITLAQTRAYGEIGFSLNAGGTQGVSFNNRTSGSRLYFFSGYAPWQVNRSGGNTSLSYVPLENIFKDYIFTIRITSGTTADVYLTVDGTDYRAYNLTMNGTSNIDAFSIWGNNMWDGSSNENAYWKQTCTVTNSKRVELGYYLTSGTYTPGLISDGLDAANTTITSVNEVIVGGDAGSSVVFNQANTYTGATRVNANAKLIVAAGGTPGIGSDVYISSNGSVEINTNTTVASLRETGMNDGGTAAIANGVTLTINGADKGTFYQNSISGQGNINLSGTGTTTFSLYGNQAYTGTTTIAGGTLSTSVNMSSSLISVFNGATFSITDNVAINNLSLESGSTLNIAAGKTLTINGTLTIKGNYIISGGGTLAYGANGILKYEGSTIPTTSDDVFPASNGPNDLEIADVGTAGISLHANRTLTGALTISANELFIIPTGKWLTINGNLTNNAGAAGLLVESGGSLITNGSITGNATVKRDITGQDKFHFISSPVNSVTIGSVFPEAQYDNIYVRRYDEPSGSWVNLGIADNMATGTGYSFFMNELSTTATFAGSLNNASVTPTLSYAGSGDEDYVNWNLLGNPFASAIDWDELNWARSGINGSVYTWDGTSGNYLSWSGSAGSLTGGIIPAQQGFFVKVDNETAPTITIPATARVHSSGFYKSGESTALELAITNSVNAYSDKTYLQSNPEATAEFDSQFDAYKLDGETEAPELYTMTGETRLSINSMPVPSESLNIPLYLKPGVEGSFTLTASGLETIGGNVILNDLTSGTLTDLSLNPSYTFQAAPDDDLHRFNLLFSPVGVIETPLMNTGIYSYGKTIFVQQQLAQEARLSVVNLTGQTVFTQNLGGAGLLSFETRLPAGVYIVRIVSNEGTLSSKVVIR